MALVGHQHGALPTRLEVPIHGGLHGRDADIPDRRLLPLLHHHGLGEEPVQDPRPLLDELIGRHQHDAPHAGLQCRGDRDDADQSLAGAGDRLHDADVLCVAPRLQRIPLPSAQRGPGPQGPGIIGDVAGQIEDRFTVGGRLSGGAAADKRTRGRADGQRRTLSHRARDWAARCRTARCWRGRCWTGRQWTSCDRRSAHRLHAVRRGLDRLRFRIGRVDQHLGGGRRHLGGTRRHVGAGRRRLLRQHLHRLVVGRLPLRTDPFPQRSRGAGPKLRPRPGPRRG